MYQCHLSSTNSFTEHYFIFFYSEIIHLECTRSVSCIQVHYIIFISLSVRYTSLGVHYINFFFGEGDGVGNTLSVHYISFFH